MQVSTPGTLCVDIANTPCGLFAGLWGYVQYPVMGLASGLAPLSAISNSTEPLNKCIEVSSNGGKDPLYVGRNVSSQLHNLHNVMSNCAMQGHAFGLAVKDSVVIVSLAKSFAS